MKLQVFWKRSCRSPHASKGAVLKLLIHGVLLFLMMTDSAFSQQPPIENGVPQALAQWRAKHYSNVRYKLDITLEKGAPLMKGNIEIRVTLDDEGAKNDLILDWRTTQFQNDKDKPFANVVGVNDAPDILTSTPNEHIRIPQPLLKKGENIIKIQFASPIKTSGSAITRYIDKEDGSEYIYSLFVPSDASTAFPVFDQPDLKARFLLKLVTPPNWQAVSNTNGFGWRKEENSTFATYDFPETKPISTYVFAFSAGNFEVFQDRSAQIISEKDGIRTINKSIITPKIYVRKSQAEKFKPHAQEIFRLNRECVKYLEEYFDYKFPFPKYDFVLIPEFPFGGMEHAGATFLRESSIIFPQEPTKNDYISRAILIFHETAHQWFGDTVTMKWFDDLWLKEGFATFMAFKALEKIMPEMNAWKAFYERNKVAAYQTDATKGTTPIYQEIPNLSAAKSAYGAIVYSKAPSFLRQAEFYLGEKEFQMAVRSFLKRYEFKNATWQDLVKEFEVVYSEKLPRDKMTDQQMAQAMANSRELIRDWTNIWVRQKGVSIIKNTLSEGKITKEGGRTKIQGFGITHNFSDSNIENLSRYQQSLKHNQLVRLLYSYGEKNYVESDSISDGTSYYYRPEIIEKLIPPAKIPTPKFVFPNYQDYGYGIFLLDEKSRAYILANVQDEKDDFLRAMMYGSLWDSVREAELDPKDYVELVIKNVANEKDETIVSSMLGRANTALNYYIEGGNATVKERVSNPKSKIPNLKSKDTLPNGRVSASGRDQLIQKLEDVLINKMQTAETLGQRITFYRSFLNVASSEKARGVLKEVLSGKFKIEGLNCRGDSCGRPITATKTDVDNKSTTASVIRRFGQAQDLPLQTILKTKDKFDIVTKLFILGDKDAENLLAELVKTETSDDAKRYAYAARAGIATAENKAKFWNDFVNNKEISENWIEAAFVPFNSVRHANLTAAYLEKALAELPNLKRNRKIFFVNGWLGAFIGGQKDEKALEIVNKFLADNPNLDKDLRLKILENVDVIERAVKIRTKFK